MVFSQELINSCFSSALGFVISLYGFGRFLTTLGSILPERFATRQPASENGWEYAGSTLTDFEGHNLSPSDNQGHRPETTKHHLSKVEAAGSGVQFLETSF